MRRGQRALHYHLFAGSTTRYLAEFGEDNGMNLYAEYNYAIKLAVLSTQGLVDNSFFCEGCWHCPGHAQWASDGGRNQLGKDYVASFPDPVISKYWRRRRH